MCFSCGPVQSVLQKAVVQEGQHGDLGAVPVVLKRFIFPS